MNGGYQMERTIRVTGKGKLSVKPDRIRLKLELEETQPEYDNVLRLSTEMTEQLKDVFGKLGFERRELKTLYFNVDTVYESYQDSDKNWKRRFKGYKYVHRMKIEFEADNVLLGKVLYALAHCTVKPEFSIEYTVSEPEKCKNELLGKAVEDSREKAEVISKAAGVSIGEILNIDYSWGEIDFVTKPVDEMMLKCCECEPDSDSSEYDIDIEADDIDITDTVTVVWSIK
jgi:hypothetical protein